MIDNDTYRRSNNNDDENKIYNNNIILLHNKKERTRKHIMHRDSRSQPLDMTETQQQSEWEQSTNTVRLSAYHILLSRVPSALCYREDCHGRGGFH